jgi:hypothetical protein
MGPKVLSRRLNLQLKNDLANVSICCSLLGSATAQIYRSVPDIRSVSI